MTNPNEPAFPAEWTEPDEGGQTRMLFAQGMTKREYFAAMAMQGLVVDTHMLDRLTRAGLTVAQEAVLQADALIAELSK